MIWRDYIVHVSSNPPLININSLINLTEPADVSRILYPYSFCENWHLARGMQPRKCSCSLLQLCLAAAVSLSAGRLRSMDVICHYLQASSMTGQKLSIKETGQEPDLRRKRVLISSSAYWTPCLIGHWHPHGVSLSSEAAVVRKKRNKQNDKRWGV